MEYRHAELRDIEALCRIRKQQLTEEGNTADCNIDKELKEFFQSQIQEKTLTEWIAEEDGMIAATAAVQFLRMPPTFRNPSGIRGYVTNMYTAPQYRRRGIASRLLELVKKEAEKRGVHQLLLHASRDGRFLYEARGFQKLEDWMELKL